MSRRIKRLLVAVDGSERAWQTVRYAGEESAFKGMQIILFHVFNAIPQAYYDLEKMPKSVKVVSRARGWEAQQRKNIGLWMEEAHRLLVDAGCAASAVTIKIQDRKKGIARDIIAEAHSGYDALLIRRRGASTLKNMIVGGVTNKLLEKIGFVPLLIAGRRPVNRKVLVAVDGSPCADRAVAFTADMLGPLEGYKVKLLHVVRDGSDVPATDLSNDGLEDVSAIFQSAADRFIAAGFSPNQILTKTVTGAPSRAGAIVATAERGGWGTIVVGRRGLTRLKDFFMGRVSNKVVYAGRLDTVWIVP